MDFFSGLAMPLVNGTCLWAIRIFILIAHQGVMIVRNAKNPPRILFDCVNRLGNAAIVYNLSLVYFCLAHSMQGGKTGVCGRAGVE